ncbi:MAG: hypothetical protein Q9173_003901 [Seirophora scorigena]
MDSATLRMLLDSQAPALRVLKVEQYGGGPKIFSPLPHIPGIDSLCVYSLEDRASRSMVEEVLSQHSGSIRHLCLGAENFAALLNHNPTDKAMALELMLHGVRRMARQLVKRYVAVRLEESRESPALRLESCTLKGLEADSILQSLGSTLVDVTNLTSLCLESCSGLERALQFLSGTDGGPSMMKLQSFVLRHTTADFKFGESLLKFLQSVPGLAHMSVLLESPNQVGCLRAILQVHGQTLKSLVWDEQPIGHNTRNLLIPPYSQLKDIFEHCPGLIELGLCLNWETFTGARVSFVVCIDPRIADMINILIITQEAQRLFGMPKSLRTLNIRNMPPGGVREDQLYAANSVLETIFNTANVGESPPLETLALGALTYRDLRKGLSYTWSQDEETHLYQAFCLHVYRTKWQYPFDKRKPLATLHEIGSYERTEAGGGSVNVLKPYWLNRGFVPAGG